MRRRSRSWTFSRRRPISVCSACVRPSAELVARACCSINSQANCLRRWSFAFGTLTLRLIPQYLDEPDRFPGIRMHSIGDPAGEKAPAVFARQPGFAFAATGCERDPQFLTERI